MIIGGFQPASPLVMHPVQAESMADTLQIFGVLGSGFASSSAWPAANRAIFYPVRLRDRPTIKRLWLFNGTAVSGNFDIGIFDEGFNKIISTGSTAQSGTSAIQYATVTDTLIGPGLYYIGLALDNTTATIFRSTVVTVGNLYMMGLREQASAFALPSTASFASSISSAYLPMFGYSQRSV